MSSVFTLGVSVSSSTAVRGHHIGLVNIHPALGRPTPLTSISKTAHRLPIATSTSCVLDSSVSPAEICQAGYVPYDTEEVSTKGCELVVVGMLRFRVLRSVRFGSQLPAHAKVLRNLTHYPLLTRCHLQSSECPHRPSGCAQAPRH